MLLSDRDILAAQKDGHISLDPWTPEMVQPASIDVRLDRFFRLFNNHAYTYVDPAENQGALTEQFDVAPDEPWILHPGEFALGSTGSTSSSTRRWRHAWRAKSSLGRLGILTFDGRLHRPRFRGAYHAGAEQRVDASGQALARHEDRADVLLPAQLSGRAPLRLQGHRLPLSGPARPDPQPFLRELLQGRRQRLEPIPKFFDAMCRRLHDWAAGTLLCSVRCRLAYWRMAVNSTDWAGCSDGGRNP